MRPPCELPKYRTIPAFILIRLGMWMLGIDLRSFEGYRHMTLDETMNHIHRN